MRSQLYEGERDYESLAAFAKENISKPICSHLNIEHCSPEETAIINDLRKKSRAELDEITDSVMERVTKAQEGELVGAFFFLVRLTELKTDSDAPFGPGVFFCSINASSFVFSFSK